MTRQRLLDPTLDYRDGRPLLEWSRILRCLVPTRLAVLVGYHQPDDSARTRVPGQLERAARDGATTLEAAAVAARSTARRPRPAEGVG